MFFLPALLFLATGGDLRLDGSASVVDEAGRHVIRVEVATNLPDQALVEGELYYLVQEPSEEDPSVKEWVEKPVLGAMSHAPVSDGLAVIDLARYTSRPYPLPYRIWLEYDPNVQDPLVRDAAPVARRVRKSFDFKYGDPADFKKIVEERRANYYADYVSIDRLYHDLNQTFMEFWREPKWDRDAWERWKRSWVAKVERTKEYNDDRMTVGLVPFDWKGQGSVEAMCIELLGLAGGCSDLLEEKKGTKPLPTEAQEAMRRFRRMYDDGFAGMDFDAQVDLSSVLPDLDAVKAEVQKVGDFLRAWKDGKDFDREAWGKAREAIAGQVLEHMLKLSSEVPRSSVYKRLSDLSADIEALLGRCDQAFAGPDRSSAAEITGLIDSLASRLDEIKTLLQTGGQK